MSYYPFTFETNIVHHDLGTYRYTVVFLDPAHVSQLPLDEYPRLRISGEIDDIPFDGAWQPSKGRYFLMLSKKLMKDGRFQVGDEVEVRFRVEDQNAVDVPQALSNALAENDKANAFWETLTAGKQRALAHRVMSAKRAPTVAKRVVEVIDWLSAEQTNLRKLGKI